MSYDVGRDSTEGQLRERDLESYLFIFMRRRGRDELGFPARAVDDVACSYTKLHAWRLLHLSKGVFLDADTLVLSNCDELFERRELSAVPLRGWPDLFDTGVFVFQPSEKTYGTVSAHRAPKGCVG
ncbi:hypothetical protein HPB48_012825 [Haemaphysalis longicornis]|uniref:Uncharacterized protein n=1 Tax=Haemaphysalis longicornis TaxID=44386 RepID=A0A9J6GLF2_HAELO|nr:hypothetical protein HPB48_012825 [Haemaphysalis longicornis]